MFCVYWESAESCQNEIIGVENPMYSPVDLEKDIAEEISNYIPRVGILDFQDSCSHVGKLREMYPAFSEDNSSRDTAGKIRNQGLQPRS